MKIINTTSIYDAFKEMLEHEGDKDYTCVIPCRNLFVCNYNGSRDKVQMKAYSHNFLCACSYIYLTDRPSFREIDDIVQMLQNGEEGDFLPNTYHGVKTLLRYLTRRGGITDTLPYSPQIVQMQEDIIYSTDLTLPSILITEGFYNTHEKYITHVADAIRDRLQSSEEYKFDIPDAVLYLAMHGLIHENSFSPKNHTYKTLFTRTRHNDSSWAYLCDIYDALQKQPMLPIDVNTIISTILP